MFAAYRNPRSDAKVYKDSHGYIGSRYHPDSRDTYTDHRTSRRDATIPTFGYSGCHGTTCGDLYFNPGGSTHPNRHASAAPTHIYGYPSSGRRGATYLNLHKRRLNSSRL